MEDTTIDLYSSPAQYNSFQISIISTIYLLLDVGCFCTVVHIMVVFHFLPIYEIYFTLVLLYWEWPQVLAVSSLQGDGVCATLCGEPGGQGSQIVTSIFTICGENPFYSAMSISAVHLHWLQLESPFLFQQEASPSQNMWYFNVHWCQHWVPSEGWWLGWWDHDTGTISAGCGPWLMTARLCIQTQITASHPGITPQTLTPRHREDQRGHVNMEWS